MARDHGSLREFETLAVGVVVRQVSAIHSP
jgi:hypothetical protein